MYLNLMQGEADPIIRDMREWSSKYIIANIISSYVEELKGKEVFNKISVFVNLASTKIRSWIIIEDDDDLTEGYIILATAKVNSKYQDTGFCISNTIVEKSDNIDSPPQYIKLSL